VGAVVADCLNIIGCFVAPEAWLLIITPRLEDAQTDTAARAGHLLTAAALARYPPSLVPPTAACPLAYVMDHEVGAVMLHVCCICLVGKLVVHLLLATWAGCAPVATGSLLVAGRKQLTPACRTMCC
jgi:hypothetical protein